MNRFHEIELEKSFDLISTIENMRIQVGIFFATVNLGVLSIGVSKEKVIFFFFAALLFWAMAIIDDAARKMLIHYYFRVTRLHKRYVKGDVTYSPNTFSRLAGDIVNIVNLETDENRLVKLRRLPVRRRNLYGFWLPIISSLIEIAFAIYLLKVFGWQFI